MKTMIALLMMAALTAGTAYGDVIGFPWSTWGVISYSPDGSVDRGVILNTYAEQGIDWLKIGRSDWIFNTFAGVDLAASDHPAESWNNRARPTLGLKLKHAFEPGGDLDIGVRGEHSEYFRNSAADDWRAVAFVQWSAGGNWKK